MFPIQNLTVLAFHLFKAEENIGHRNTNDEQQLQSELM